MKAASSATLVAMQIIHTRQCYITLDIGNNFLRLMINKERATDEFKIDEKTTTHSPNTTLAIELRPIRFGADSYLVGLH